MARLFTVTKDKWNGYTPELVFQDCFFGVKKMDDEEYNWNVALIDNEGDIIRMKLQYEKEISKEWFSFAKEYRIPKTEIK